MTQCMVAEPQLSRNLSDSAAHGNLSAAFCCCLSHQAAAWTRLELCCQSVCCQSLWKRLPFCCCDMLSSSVSWGQWQGGCQLATFSHWAPTSLELPPPPGLYWDLWLLYPPRPPAPEVLAHPSFLVIARCDQVHFSTFRGTFWKLSSVQRSIPPPLLSHCNEYIPFLNCFVEFSLGLWEGGKETHLFIS